MSKVDWINWKTNKEEIINPEKIENQISDCFDKYNTYMNPVVYEQIKYEVQRGGLSKDAFNIEEISPSNEMAIDILNKIDEIKQIMVNLSQDIKDLSNDQKKDEKNQLIEEIKKKLEKEQKVIDNVRNNEELKEHIIEMGENPKDIEAVIIDRISKLRKRLEEAESI